MTLIRIAAGASMLGCLAVPALGQDESAYLDDRSSAGKLVESFYNAVNRKEYARAWDYFGDTKPAKDFEAFEKGFDDTESVSVLTGAASIEGAAGSTFFDVPVAIEAKKTDGSRSVFAGCYTARMANPQIQEPPFRPLHLEKGELKVAEGSLETALPAQCGDGPAPPPRDLLVERAQAAFRASYSESCETAAAGSEPAKPDEIDIEYPGSGEEKRLVRLFRFACSMGAYNSIEVYYVGDDLGALKQLHFAEPELDIRYDDPETRSTVSSIRIEGFTETDRIANSDYDERTRTITSFSKWRGAGDASAIGTYLFRDGHFSLVKYEVDASENGEVDPETVLDYDTPP